MEFNVSMLWPLVGQIRGTMYMLISLSPPFLITLFASNNFPLTPKLDYSHGPALPPDEFGEEPHCALVNCQGLGINSSTVTISVSPPVGEHLTL